MTTVKDIVDRFRVGHWQVTSKENGITMTSCTTQCQIVQVWPNGIALNHDGTNWFYSDSCMVHELDDDRIEIHTEGLNHPPRIDVWTLVESAESRDDP